MMLRPQLAFDADGDGAKHGEAVAGAIIACVRKQLLETMAECGMDGAQADAALDVLLERTQILAAKAPADITVIHTGGCAAFLHVAKAE